MRKCSDTVVGLDKSVGLPTGLRCSLKRSLCRLLVSPIRFILTTFSEISPCYNDSVRNRFGMGTGETCQVLIGADSYKNEIRK